MRRRKERVQGPTSMNVCLVKESRAGRSNWCHWRGVDGEGYAHVGASFAKSDNSENKSF